MTQNLNAYNRRKYGARTPGWTSYFPKYTPKATTGDGKVHKPTHRLDAPHDNMTKEEYMDWLWKWFDVSGHKKMTEEQFLVWAVNKVKARTFPKTKTPTTRMRIIRQGVAINYRNEEDNPFF